MYLLISVLILFTGNFYRRASDEIRWSAEKKLTYADFSGPAPASSPFVANTNSNIFFSYDYNDNKLSGVMVYSSFTPSKSWMKKKIPEILQHEQLHFDITELFARKLYSESSAMIGSDVTPDQLKGLFKKANSDCNEMQNQYDNESEHGVNEEKQEAWQKQIKQILNDTPAYPSDLK